MNNSWQKAEIIAKKLLILTVFLGFFVLALYLVPKLLVLFLPLVVAYIISLIATPVTHVLEKLHLPSPISAIISILSVAAVLLGLSYLVINALLDQVYNFFDTLPSFYESFSSTFVNIKDAATDAYSLLPKEIAPHIEEAFANFDTYLTSISAVVIETLSTWAIAAVKNIPDFLLALLFSILASYFFIRDKKKLKARVSFLIGPRLTSILKVFRDDIFSAILAYLRAQGILMSITFVEVFIGLSVMRVEYSFLFAIVIAIVDAVPVFGTGTILLPWALFSLLSGAYTQTIGLALLYAICLIVRQILEPKVLSTQIGMHPLLTLLAIYVGFKLFGIFGMLFGPAVALISKNCIDRYIKSHNRAENEQKDAS